MKIKRVRLQSKLDEFLLFIHMFSTMKITRVSLQSKLDELIFFFYKYSSIKITRVSLQSKLDKLIFFLYTYSSPVYNCNVPRDENDARFIAMEAGITKVITAAYLVMKMTRVSLQWQRE